MGSLPIVLLIFISSNYPQTDINEGTVIPPTPQPERGFSESGKSPKDYRASVNDLTAAEFKFPDDHSRGLLLPGKIIREKLVPDEKSDKNKTPVPLYSLVKNDCGDGYALDENGICQKTIAVRSGKKLDEDRRRKRQASSYEWLTQREPEMAKAHSNERDRRKASSECNSFYPGLVGDKNGGCTKALRTSEGAFDKALPP